MYNSTINVQGVAGTGYKLSYAGYRLDTEIPATNIAAGNTYDPLIQYYINGSQPFNYTQHKAYYLDEQDKWLAAAVGVISYYPDPVYEIFGTDEDPEIILPIK